MKEIYQIDDKVFHYKFGWGKIVKLEQLKEYPVCVKFDLCTEVENFTKTGFYVVKDLKPSLSFTEYDFVNGGFSQNREDINKHLIGKLGWFWDNEDKLDGSDYIQFGILSSIKDSRFKAQDNNCSGHFDNFSLECPIKLNEEQI